MKTFKVQWIADAITNGYYQLRRVTDNDKSIMKYIEDTQGIKVTSKLVRNLIKEITQLKELQKNAAKGAESFSIDYGIWAVDKKTEVMETSEDTSIVKIEDLI